MVETAMVQYDALVSGMKNKLTLGLITFDEYMEFISKEDTLFNLIDAPPNRMTLVKKRKT